MLVDYLSIFIGYHDLIFFTQIQVEKQFTNDTIKCGNFLKKLFHMQSVVNVVLFKIY